MAMTQPDMGALAIGLSRPDAEEVVQEAFVAFFLKEVEGEEPEAICNVLGVNPTNL